MIHTCQERNWYVNKFLVPSLIEQNIPQEDIIVWLDKDKKGNLKSCLESFSSCVDINEDTWHLQDDVVICKNFLELSNQFSGYIVCGYVNKEIGPNADTFGKVPVNKMWLSFPCIKIPNKYAIEFVDWFNSEAISNCNFQDRIKRGKSDDWFFRKFLKIKYKDITIINMNPNLVNHIDYMLGGSIANPIRKNSTPAYYWDDYTLIRELENKINNG